MYKALAGVAPIAKFKVLDKVLVNKDCLPTWRVDWGQTEKLLFQGKMRAVITDVNLQRRASYKITYEYVETGNSLEKKTLAQWDVEEQYITLVPDEFIDDDDKHLWPK